MKTLTLADGEFGIDPPGHQAITAALYYLKDVHGMIPQESVIETASMKFTHRWESYQLRLTARELALSIDGHLIHAVTASNDWGPELAAAHLLAGLRSNPATFTGYIAELLDLLTRQQSMAYRGITERVH
ncbi:TPA: hypothetical protein RQN04_002026 [Aeromonas hydrophila]|nr:hypothetical protein [Aeromonas hydrophila]